jgi:di/tricarboxylate transporter
VPDLPPDQLIVLAVLGVSLGLFITDKLRYDVVAILVVITLAMTGVLSPDQAYAGLASPAVILVACMYVFGFSVAKWGLAEQLGQRLLLRGDSENISEARLLLRITMVAGLLSALLSNAGVVAALIPVISTVAKRTKIAVSRLLIPLSYASLIGGMMTLIGTSKNIAVNDLYRNMTQELDPNGIGRSFGLFEFSAFGFCLLLGIAVYFVGPGRALLPTAEEEEELTDRFETTSYISELDIPDDCSLIGMTIVDTKLNDHEGVRVLGIIRPNAESLLAPGRYNRLTRGDALLLQGDSAAILEVRKEFGLTAAHVTPSILAGKDVSLVEAVVPAGSELAGSTLAEADFAASTGLNVLGLSSAGAIHHTKIGRIPLVVGDSLLVQGHRPDIERLRKSRNLIILDEVRTPISGKGAGITLGLLVGVVALAALSSIHISLAGMLGVVALLATRVVTPNEIRGAVDWSVLILIGGMMALGKAFQTSGLAGEIAHSIAAANYGPTALIVALLLATMALTQVMNYVAAALIMTPVAIDMAAQIPGDNEKVLLMAVVTGASLAFMTPVAHQCNAMVMGPGGYKYRDFIRVGAPLTIFLTILSVLLLPRFF